MKKTLKTKIALAGLTVAVAATAITASTYSWFLERTDDGGERGATASVQAAEFNLGADENTKVGSITDIELLDDFDETDVQLREGLPALLSYNPASDLIYPGEGKRLTIDNLGEALALTTNRTVVLELDLSNVGEDIASVTDIDLTAPDIHYEISLLDDNDGWYEFDGKYYRVVEATAGEETALIGGLKIEFGIIGTQDVQNEYMSGIISVGAGEMSNSIKATAVQTTPAAVLEVFDLTYNATTHELIVPSND